MDRHFTWCYRTSGKCYYCLFYSPGPWTSYEFCSKCLGFIYTCTKHEWPRAGMETMWRLCEHYSLQRLVPIMGHNPISCWVNSASEAFSAAVGAATIENRKLFAAHSLGLKYPIKSFIGCCFPHCTECLFWNFQICFHFDKWFFFSRKKKVTSCCIFLNSPTSPQTLLSIHEGLNKYS